MSKWANPHFAWVSPLVNFKKRLFSYEHKEVIANNGTNKGASETKLCSHVGGKPPFSYLYCFPDFPKKWGSPLVLKSDQLCLGDMLNLERKDSPGKENIP